MSNFSMLRRLFYVIKDIFDDFYTVPPGYFAKVTLIDRCFEKTLLPIFPRWVIPNYLTLFRFFSIPPIIFLFLSNNLLWAGILFGISAFSDALDGAMARTRDQITEWGIVNDPLADKMLIGTVVAIAVTKYISFYFAAAIISLELFIALAALYQAQKRKSKIVPAKLVGKLKMILESLGVAFLFLFILFSFGWAWWTAVVLLSCALCFALLSLFVYKSI